MLLCKANNRKRKCPALCQAEAQQDYRSRSKQDVRVLVAGSTGYIGKYVTKELIQRGYNVVAFAREKSGVGGKQSWEQTQKVLSPSHLCSLSPCVQWPVLLPNCRHAGVICNDAFAASLLQASGYASSHQ